MTGADNGVAALFCGFLTEIFFRLLESDDDDVYTIQSATATFYNISKFSTL